MMKNYMGRSAIEQSQDWRGWIEKMPHLNFNNKWNVRVIPPFAGALVRFLIDYKGNNVSVYLDVENNLGYMNGPYWEIYPAFDGDTDRYLLNEIEGLLKAITKSLKRNTNPPVNDKEN